MRGKYISSEQIGERDIKGFREGMVGIIQALGRRIVAVWRLQGQDTSIISRHKPISVHLTITTAPTL